MSLPPVLSTPASILQLLERVTRQLEHCVGLPLRQLWQSATPADRAAIGEELDELDLLVRDVRRALGIEVAAQNS